MNLNELFFMLKEGGLIDASLSSSQESESPSFPFASMKDCLLGLLYRLELASLTLKPLIEQSVNV